MPEISRFFGIVISMYYDDHPPPHFHVRYGAQKGLVSIESLSVLRGELRPRVLGLVTEWAAMHQSELLENWRRAREYETLNPISSLE